MLKNKLIFFILLLLFCSFSIEAENNLQIRVYEEPKNNPWWQRTEFFPVHTTIRGIPLHEIEKTWHLASELNKKAIPNDLLFKEGSDLMAQSQLVFSRTGDFNQDGIDDLALVGVYEDCTLQFGRFFLILTKNRSDKWDVSFIRLINDPKFIAISKDGPIKIWLCMECDDGFDLRWDSNKMEYILKPFTES